MLLGPVDSRDLPVGHVAHERVREGVLSISLDRRASLAPDELPPFEAVQRLLEFACRAAPDRCQGSVPEDLADDGGILQQRLLRLRERIETGGDQTVDGLGQRQLVVCALVRDPREFLGVERVAAGTLEQSRLNLGRKNCAVEELMEKLRRLVFGQRRERDRRRIRFPAAPPRTTREQLRPGSGDDEEGDGARPVDQVVGEVEQTVVCPVEVFEYEHERVELGQALEEPPPGGEALGAAIRSQLPGVTETEQRSELTPHQLCFVDVYFELRACPVLGLALEDRGVGLQDLAEGPERAFAVGKAGTLTAVDEIRLRLDRRKELVHEPALADPRHADERQELRCVLVAHPCERVDQQVKLPLATDQRGARLEADVRAVAGTRLDCLPDRYRRRLALSVDRRQL